jgi:hypothetical protein
MRLTGFLLLCLIAAAAHATDVIVLPSKAGDVRFQHARHYQVPGGCVTCHHTSKPGDTTPPACRDCHQAGNGVRSAYRAFHDSCIGCHEKAARAGEPAGPVKRCSGCHRRAGK